MKRLAIFGLLAASALAHANPKVYPEAKLQITFPEGWKLLENRDVTSATSPDDYAIALVLAAPDPTIEIAEKAATKMASAMTQIKWKNKPERDVVHGLPLVGDQGTAMSGKSAVDLTTLVITHDHQGLIVVLIVPHDGKAAYKSALIGMVSSIMLTPELHKQVKDDLAKSSGMKDDAVLEALIEVGINANTVPALALVPVVELSWSDGKLDAPEKKLVDELAEAKSIRPGTDAYKVIEPWFDHAPSEPMFAAWELYMTTLMKQLDAPQRALLKKQIDDATLKAAKHPAKLSPAEAVVMKRIDAPFGK